MLYGPPEAFAASARGGPPAAEARAAPEHARSQGRSHGARSNRLQSISTSDVDCGLRCSRYNGSPSLSRAAIKAHFLATCRLGARHRRGRSVSSSPLVDPDARRPVARREIREAERHNRSASTGVRRAGSCRRSTITRRPELPSCVLPGSALAGAQSRNANEPSLGQVDPHRVRPSPAVHRPPPTAGAVGTGLPRGPCSVNRAPLSRLCS